MQMSSQNYIMLKVTATGLIFITTVLGSDENSEVQRINAVQGHWTASENIITKKGENYIKRLLGAKQSNSSLPVRGYYSTSVKNGLPVSFDARENWRNCPSISSVKDQSQCGSCWAIATTSCMSDRICISTKGKVKASISSQNLLSCCSDCHDPKTSGCDGGYADKAYLYYQNNGLVTGGDYNSNEGCQPYEFGSPEKRSGLNVPSCTKKCTNKLYKIPFRQDKYYGKSSYSISPNIVRIQADIMEYGPVTATFDIYSDFPFYKSGIYTRTSSRKLLSHSVKVLGWGIEKNVQYWLVANSWGKAWGENGMFKIRRGTNECGFESQITAGLPKLP